MMLAELFKKHGTDKLEHGYADFYEGYFGPIRESVKSFLEIGVYHGASMRVWLEYFPNARVCGLDDARWQKSWDFGTDRAAVILVDQCSRGCLAEVLKRTVDAFDIVLDDGGHTMWQQQVSLAGLLPGVKSGGLYVLEDLHSSFMPVIGYGQKGAYSSLYATGCDFPLTTTYDVLSKWPDVKSDYMTQDEWDVAVSLVGEVDIFDRDGDHRHVTAVLEVL